MFRTAETAPLSTTTLFDAGRIILASLFVIGGVDKIADPAPSLAMMDGVGLPFPNLLIWLVIGIELGFGLVVAAGGWVAQGRYVVAAALLLTLATNVPFHDFCTFEEEHARLELSLFFKNLSIMSGLAMVAGLYGMRRNA